MRPSWRNLKHANQWTMTLGNYAFNIRRCPVADVTVDDVLEVLKPIWQSKPETASRLRGRIERVLDATEAQGLRFGENPARWRGHPDPLLPKRQRLTRGHHAAMPSADVPDPMIEFPELDVHDSCKSYRWCSSWPWRQHGKLHAAHSLHKSCST